MKIKSKLLTWEQYTTPSQLPEKDRLLLQYAKDNLRYSYSPYSNFQVAAAILLQDGIQIAGTNQENASYPLCLCAERVALAAVAATYPNSKIEAMAITVKNPIKPVQQPAMPCGACRQVICESEQRQHRPIRLIIQGESGPIYVFQSGLDVLPFAFDGSYLGGY